MPEEWRRSVLVPIFKNKGDVQTCSNYRGIKLISHTIKLWERVVKARLREEVSICEQQYGLMPRKSTTDTVYALKMLMEKYREVVMDSLTDEGAGGEDPGEYMRVNEREGSGGVRLQREEVEKVEEFSILLANVQSLENKVNDLRARIKFQRDILDCNLLCFTETWLNPAVPDHAIQPAEFFSFHLMDRTLESGKSSGGGLCLMVSNHWWDSASIVPNSRYCTPNLELLTIYLPREFSSVKKPKPTCLNDYHPVALTAVVIKCFKRLVRDWILYSSRIAQTALLRTLISTNDRPQTVWVGKHTSSTLTLSTGAPQGCVLSPLLYSLYIYDCVATTNSTTIIVFADDTVVVGLIFNNDEAAYLQKIKNLERWFQENNLLLTIRKTKELIVDFSMKQERSYQLLNIKVERVDSFQYLGVHTTQDLSWSFTLTPCHNNLELNTLKSVEMIVDFRRNPLHSPPLTIMNSTVATVESFRFLGTTISQGLKWNNHIDFIVKKDQQRLYFLHQLMKFDLPQQLLKQFYSAIMESVLCSSITVWFGLSYIIRHQKITEEGLNG
ncbi:gastrula zinc finger protein XlCGF28.1-like [Silurus meridionalis]|nr:gastrula zinc finger protein XlCGF28.1-like [Silurus meridionalis]